MHAAVLTRILRFPPVTNSRVRRFSQFLVWRR